MGFFKRLIKVWKELSLDAARQTYYQTNWLPAAIMAGGSILSTIFGGAAKKKAAKTEKESEYQYGKKAAEDRIARADKAGLRPQTPRHEYWSGLSQIAPFMQNAIMGSFSDIFGQDTLSKWGSSYSPSEGGGQGPIPPGAGGGSSIAPPGGGGSMPPDMGGGRRPMPPWMRRRGGYDERF